MLNELLLRAAVEAVPFLASAAPDNIAVTLPKPSSEDLAMQKHSEVLAVRGKCS